MRTALSFMTCLLLAVAMAILSSPPSHAQETPERLIDQEPFDRITLDAENQNAVIKVEPIPLPGRKVPQTPDPESKLRVRLLGKPDQAYDIAWRHIVRLELFEQMVLAEARQQIAADKLDDAYDTLQYLKRDYPGVVGLDDAIQNYLYVNAGRAFQGQRWAEALAVLEELQKLNPDYRPGNARPLGQVYATVLQKMIEGYIARQDYRAARAMLTRIKRDFGDAHQAAVQTWETRLQQMASNQLAAARKFIEQGDDRQATRALREQQRIWPDLPGGKELAAEVGLRYPLVMVGVTQSAQALDAGRLDDWAARRAGSLFGAQLFEFLKPGAEGGQYRFRWGSLQTSEDRRRLTLKLEAVDDAAIAGQPTGYDLARQLLAMADPHQPEFSLTWARIFSGATVSEVMRVDVDLRHPYVLPQAVLQVPWLRSTGLYEAMPANGQERYFVAPEQSLRAVGAPAEIVERLYDDPRAAVTALQRGEIDVLDRVFPADVKRLAADSRLRVEAYRLPTLHMLVPTPGRPLPASRTLRRAVLYGTQREAILRDQLLGNHPLPGCRLISGPFSPGIEEKDQLAYAVDPDLQPRAYNPRLAATLVRLAEKEFNIAAEKTKAPPPKLELVLGHPSSEVARVACEAIAAQLGVIGLPCRLQALPPGETRDLQNECDFVYTEVVIGEPVVHARRLLSAEGIARLQDPYINLALRKLDEAINWRQARSRLREIHQQVYADVSIIPLWQLTEHYAARQQLTGLSGQPLSLYENVSAWRLDGTLTQQVTRN